MGPWIRTILTMAVALLVGTSSSLAGVGKTKTQCTPEAANELFERSHALVIGVDKYQHWPHLSGAVNDAKAMAKVLKSRGFTVQMLLDEQATRDGIIEALSKLEAAKPDSSGFLMGQTSWDRGEVPKQVDQGRLVVYLSGYGINQSFVPQDGMRNPSDVDVSSGSGNAQKDGQWEVTGRGEKTAVGALISNRVLQEYLNRTDFSHAMILQDTDHGSDDWMGGDPPSVYDRMTYQRGDKTRSAEARSCLDTNEVFSKPTRAALYGTRPNQRANEQTIGGRRHGVFTFSLLNALETGVADDNWDGLITARELHAYTARRMRAYADRQESVLVSRGQGEFAFTFDHHAELLRSFYQPNDGGPEGVSQACVALASFQLGLSSRTVTPQFTKRLADVVAQRSLKAGVDPPSGLERGRLTSKALAFLFPDKLPAACTIVRGVAMAPPPTRGSGVAPARSPMVSSGVFRGLIIGINQYKDPYWNESNRRIRAAVKDARAIHTILLERYRFKPENLTLLIDDEATLSRVESEIKKLREVSKPDDKVVIYYAGHGDYEDDDGETKEGSCWLLHDGMGRRCQQKSLRQHQLKRYLKKLDVKHLLLISDSCFSGALTRGGEQNDWQKKTDRTYYNLSRRPSYKVLTSGDSDREVFDATSGHSPFAGALLSVLRNPYSESGFVSARDIENSVERAYGNHTPAIDYSAHLSHLRLGKDSEGDFVFVPSAPSKETVETPGQRPPPVDSPAGRSNQPAAASKVRVVFTIKNTRSKKWDSGFSARGRRPDMRLSVNGRRRGPLCADSDRCVFGCGQTIEAPTDRPLAIKVMDSDMGSGDDLMGRLKCDAPRGQKTSCQTDYLSIEVHPHSADLCTSLKTFGKVF